MSQALYRKWRPIDFEQVVGQEHVTKTLRAAVSGDRAGHAYLFCGPRGTGKTTTARLLAKAVNCQRAEPSERPCNDCHVCQVINEGRFLDLIEIDAASNTGVDDIRDLRDKINFSPSEGRYKVYIIDEVHMLSTAAFNALLKTLEEPPPHAIFVLATTEEHKVPLTIKSRCQQFNFRLLTTAEIMERLQWVMAQEGLQVEPDALALIARQGAGSIRDAESLLDQLIVAPGETITLEQAQSVLGTASSLAVRALTDAWLDGNGTAGMNIIQQALTSGADARQFSRQMVAYLRQLLLLHAAGRDLPLDATPDEQAAMLAQVKQAERGDLIEAVKKFHEAAMAPASSWQPQLPLELAFVELLPSSRQAVAFEGPSPTDDGRAAPERQRAADGRGQPEKEATVNPSVPQGQPPAVSPTVDAAEQSATPAGEPTTNGPQAKQGGSPTLTGVQGYWSELLLRLDQQDRTLRALLRSSKPLALEGKTLILGFDYPLIKEKFERRRNAVDLITGILDELLGTQCAVRAVVSSEYAQPVSKDDFTALADELGGVVRDQ